MHDIPKNPGERNKAWRFTLHSSACPNYLIMQFMILWSKRYETKQKLDEMQGIHARKTSNRKGQPCLEEKKQKLRAGIKKKRSNRSKQKNVEVVFFSGWTNRTISSWPDSMHSDLSVNVLSPLDCLEQSYVCEVGLVLAIPKPLLYSNTEHYKMIGLPFTGTCSMTGCTVLYFGPNKCLLWLCSKYKSLVPIETT